jgi:hypothetical protein
MKPLRVERRRVQWTFLFTAFGVTAFGVTAFGVSLAGCASLSAAPSPCGDPCASLSCPSAFVCSVDHCMARCQPVPAKY